MARRTRAPHEIVSDDITTTAGAGRARRAARSIAITVERMRTEVEQDGHATITLFVV